MITKEDIESLQEALLQLKYFYYEEAVHLVPDSVYDKLESLSKSWTKNIEGEYVHDMVGYSTSKYQTDKVFSEDEVLANKFLHLI